MSKKLQPYSDLAEPHHLNPRGKDPVLIANILPALVITPDKNITVPAADKTEDYYNNLSLSDNTRRSYQSSLKHFLEWLEPDASFPIDPQLIKNYLIELCIKDKSDMDEPLGQKTHFAPPTLHRRLQAISYAHRALGYYDPMDIVSLRKLPRNIHKDNVRHDLYAVHRAKALTPEKVQMLIQHIKPGPQGLRDKALILMGLWGAFRESELTGIRFADIDAVDEGITINIRASKADQLNEKNQHKAIPTIRLSDLCPVTAMAEWIAVLNKNDIFEGHIFRPVSKNGAPRAADKQLSHVSVNAIIKNLVLKAGLKPVANTAKDLNEYSCHSLRAGLVTAMKRLNMSSEDICRQTLHTDPKMIDNIYNRPESVFDGGHHPILEVSKRFEEESGDS